MGKGKSANREFFRRRAVPDGVLLLCTDQPQLKSGLLPASHAISGKTRYAAVSYPRRKQNEGGVGVGAAQTFLPKTLQESCVFF